MARTTEPSTVAPRTWNACVVACQGLRLMTQQVQFEIAQQYFMTATPSEEQLERTRVMVMESLELFAQVADFTKPSTTDATAPAEARS